MSNVLVEIASLFIYASFSGLNSSLINDNTFVYIFVVLRSCRIFYVRVLMQSVKIVELFFIIAAYVCKMC